MSLHNQPKKYLSTCLTMLACTTVFLPAYAGAAGGAKMAQKETTINVNQNAVTVDGWMSLGWINGESGEFVYEPVTGRKVSELNWGLDNVFMLGLGGSVSPLSWLKVNAELWFKLNDGDGTMDDYDLMIPNYQYTDWSHHENVDLTKGLMFDVNAEMNFYRWVGSKFFGIIGFKHDNWKWEAKGGDYVYTTYSLYDTVGSFANDTTVITYEQNIYIPYIGIGFSSDLNPTPITFSGRLIGTNLMYGDDKDQHHLRGLVFEEEFDSGKMWAVDLAGAYHFTNHFSLKLAYHYQQFEEMKGDTKITDVSTGKVTQLSGDLAGMDNSLNMVTFSAIVNF